MDTNNVSLASYIGGCGFIFNTQAAGCLPREASAPGNYGHTKSPGAWDHFLANFSHPNETKSATKQPTRLGKLLFIPFTLPQRDYVARYTPVERQNERKSQLSYCNRILAGAIRNINAAPRRSHNIDRVITRSSSDYQFDWTCFKHCLGYFCSSDDKHIGILVTNCLSQGIVF